MGLFTLVVHVIKRDQTCRQYRLFDFAAANASEATPCDFDGDRLVVIDRLSSSTKPIVRLIELENNAITDVCKLPRGSTFSLVRLWGVDLVACVTSHRLFAYDVK